MVFFLEVCLQKGSLWEGTFCLIWRGELSRARLAPDASVEGKDIETEKERMKSYPADNRQVKTATFSTLVGSLARLIMKNTNADTVLAIL